MPRRDPFLEKRTTLEDDWISGEPLCGCDGIPCRLNRTEEDDGTFSCGSCEKPCHSVEEA